MYPIIRPESVRSTFGSGYFSRRAAESCTGTAERVIMTVQRRCAGKRTGIRILRPPAKGDISMRRLSDKKGTEILQVLAVIAILGAATVLICTAVAKSLTASSNRAVGVINDGTSAVYHK